MCCKGGAIKREAASASLPATIRGQILVAEDLCSFAKENMQSIVVADATEDEILQYEFSCNLKSRYTEVKTVPESRSCHSFIPDGERLIIKTFQ